MSRLNRSNRFFKRPLSRGAGLIKSVVRSTLEMLEERRLFTNPLADAGGPYTVAEGQTVQISGLDSTVSAGSIVSYQWDTNYSVSRGFRARFTGTSWRFTATDSGTKAIALKITDDSGNTNIATGTINITDVAPTLSLTAPNNVVEGQAFNVSWTYTDPGASDTVTAWEIDWGDDTTSTFAGTASSASHTYAEDGNYVITLTSTQTDGQTSITHNIAVNNDAPQVNATTTTPEIDEGGSVNIAFNSPNRAATLDGWVIEWGDGEVDNYSATASSATHTYADNGSYTAVVRALEPDGGEGTANVSYTVANVNPTIAITGQNANGIEGSQITVGSTATDPGTNDTLTRGWSVYRNGSHFVLPGNTNITGTNFSFTPTDNGSYVIRLTVVDKDNGSTTVNSSAVTVANADPTGVISGEPNGSIDEGTPVNLSVAASDAGSEDTFTYSWSVTKNGQAFTLPNNTDTESANFSFTPTDNGTYIATVVVTDDDEATVSVSTAAISVDNVAPTASLSNIANTADEGDSVSITATAADVGAADTLTYAWTATKDGNPFTFPSGTVTDEATLTFAYPDDGVYVLTVAVTDDDSGTVSESSTSVTVSNASPVGTLAGAATANEGSSVLVTSVITDAGAAENLTYAWSVTKDGNNFVLPNGVVTNGTSLAFEPTDNGTYVVTLDVTDKDSATIQRTHTITVDNVAPSVTINNAPTSGAEGTAITVGSNTSDVGTDDTLTRGWSVYRDGQNFVLPNGTNVTGANFTFTPTDNGSYVIRLTTVDDDAGSTSVQTDAFTVTNVAPTGTVSGEPNGSIDEGTAVNLTVTPADAGDEDTFTYSWSVTKNGDAFALPGNAVTNAANFSFTPTDNGTYVATVVVTDDDNATVSVSSTAITVDNANPSASVTESSTSVNEGVQVDVTSSITDAGSADTFTYAWSVTKGGQAYTLPNNVATDGASFSFVPNDNGTYVVSLTVTDDDNGAFTVASNSITVANVAPTAAVDGSNTGNEGASLNFSADVSDDGSADTFTYLWGVTQNGNPVTLPNGTDTASQNFTFIPEDDGSYVINLTVTDDDGDDTSASMNLTVSNVAPTVAINNVPQTGNEGAAINVTSTATDPGANDTLTYLWTVTKDGNSFTLPNGTDTASSLSFTPDDNGAYVISVAVTDKDGAVTNQSSATITVANVDPVGSIAGVPNNSINEATAVNLTGSATDDGANDTFSYAWAVTKNGQAYDLTGLTTNTSNFTFTPNDNGTYIATLTVTDNDGGMHAVDSDPITVVNVAPSGSILSPNSPSDEGTAINFTATATDASSVDTFSYAWTVTRDGFAFTLPGNAITNEAAFSFTPTDNGDYVATVVITDDDNGTFSVDSSTITINNLAPAPTISGNSSVNEATAITLTAAANDPGSEDTHSYAWSVTKDGNAFTLANGTVINQPGFTFTTGMHGTYVASCVVTDDDGDATTVTKTITVVNVAPTVTITGVPTGPRAEGSDILLTANAVDAAGDTSFTYAWSVKKSGVTVTLPNGTVTNASTFTFSPTDNGSYTVTCAVTDSGGATGTVTTNAMTITNALPSATMSGEPNGSIDEGTAVNLSVVAEDPGASDTFTYSWAVTKNGSAFTLPQGTVTNTANFSFTPTDNGSYIAICTVTDDDGGPTSVASAAITVTNVNPTASINGTPGQPQDEGTAVSLTSTAADVGTADTLSYAWSVTKDGNAYTLPNGTVTNAASFNFVPRDNGTYVVSLTVTDDDSGSVTTTSGNITINNVAPTASISGVSEADEGSTVTLTATPGDVGADDTHTYAWSVTRDGNAFTLANGTVTNAASLALVTGLRGTYVATCVVTDDDGASVTVTKTITVNNLAPTVSISGLPQGSSAEGTAISLTANATDAGGDTSFTYSWSVTKGGAAFTLPNGTDTASAGFSFTPTDNGSYIATVVVTDSGNASTTTSTSAITVTNANPTGTMSGVPGNSIEEGTEVNLSVAASDVGTADTLSYSWSVTKNGSAFTLPNGTVTNTSSFSFTPTDNGSYIATCVVTDDDSGTASITSGAITVTNATPTATIDGVPSQSQLEGLLVSLTSSVLDAGDDDTFTYAWSVTKNGNAYTLPNGAVTTASIFGFTPTDNGSYIVSLTVTDDDGASVTTQTSAFTITNANPTGTISGPTSIDEGSTIEASVSATDAGSADTLEYAWSVTKNGNALVLSQGTVTNDAAFSFTPSDNGTYVLTCVVTDDDGGLLTLTKSVTVTNVAPFASISGPNTAEEGDSLDYSLNVLDVGADDTHSYSWSVIQDSQAITLPQGTAVDGTGFSWEPRDNGAFTIQCIITDDDGGTYTAAQNILVTNIIPLIGIQSVPSSTVYEGQEINLTSDFLDHAADTEAGMSYQWTVTLGDEEVDSGTSANFDFTPSVHGEYTFSLTATDKDGGIGIAEDVTINVANIAPSEATISGLPESMDESEEATLTGSASDVIGDTLTYAWLIKRNGSNYATADTKEFNFSPHARGEYEIILTVTDTAGETTTTTSTIDVANIAPTATATFPTEATFLGDTTSFGLSIGDIPSSQELTVTWDFGDGTDTQTQSYTGSTEGIAKTHIYANSGSYTVTVTISDGVDETVKTSTVVVSRAGIRPDPLDSTKTALVVLGTNDADTILVEPGTKGKLKVTMNSEVIGSYAIPTGHVVIYGNGGTNNISVTAGVNALVFAGSIVSTVNTSSGNDIIIGTPGADNIATGAGRDIVIGGAGRDTIQAGESEDAIIADSVNWSSKTASIKAAEDAWNSTKSFSARIADMKATGLFANTRITADGASDQLFGNERSDWFVLNLAADRIRDWQAAFDAAN